MGQMSIGMRFLLVAIFIVLLVPASFYAVGAVAPATVVQRDQIVVQAPPDRVWPVVTDWRAITAHSDPQTGLKRFVGRTVVGGGDPAVGKVVRYAFATGQSWSQRLTAWQPDRTYAFENIDDGQGGLTPGDVTMEFTLSPQASAATVVDYTMSVTSHGPFNKAVAFLFGLHCGTLKGYEDLILKQVASASV